MATIILGCDSNAVHDSAYQSKVAKILEEAGHKVTKLEINSNAFASYSYSNKAKGKIGIYLIAAGTYSIADATYGNTHFKYNYFGIRPECSPKWDVSDFDTKPIGADADCPASLCAKIKGNSFKKINELVKKRSMVVTGKDASEMGNNLVKALGGEVADSSNKKSSSDSGSSIKEALKKAVSGWDGDVEVKLRGDTVYVNKIPDPTTAKLSIDEFKDVQYDTVTVTDANPSTINKLTLTFKDYELTITDEALIKRFGENAQKIAADKTIKKLEEAKSFLNREWNKVRRDDGRTVELKVDGDSKWQTGEWVRVYLPSFFIDDYMYISKTSHDEDGTNNWSTNLTLVDYPPSFGTFAEEETDEKSDEDEENSEDTEEEEIPDAE